MELIPDRREILRYLGYRGASPDEAMRREIDECVGDLNGVITPRFVYEKFELTREIRDGSQEYGSQTYCSQSGRSQGRSGQADSAQKGGSQSSSSRPAGEQSDSAQEVLHFAGIQVRSRDLARNLRGCGGVYLMAVTLGPGPDRLVRRASVGRMSRAVIYQAAAAAMTEVWCDSINERIRKEAEKEGFYTRRRFSPGYGDLPLALQKDISRILNMPKEIGVSLTDTLLMTPSKSVTALIGVSSVPASDIFAGDISASDTSAGGTRKACGESRCADCEASASCVYAAVPG